MRFGFRTHPLLLAIGALAAVTQLGIVNAQSTTSSNSQFTSASSSNSGSSSSSATSLSVTSSSFTSTITTTSNSQATTITTVIATNVTLTPTASTTTASASETSASATPIVLDTKIDPAYGVLGAVLIITGLPSAFWGHKNRWSSFFLIGFYTFALATLALILKFGVLEAVNPPNVKIRGVFVLACSIAGIAGGGVAIFFWQQSKYFIGAWGGFALGLWIQCFREGGLIRPIGYRWIMYIGLGVVGFCMCTLPRIHYHVLLASTAAVGASAFVLGIDCFTTANLKEFYVWNLGFDALFTKFTSNGIEFPISQMMQIEIGLIGAFTLMGAAVQLRILRILQYKLKEITREQKRRDEELEAQATARFAVTTKEMAIWEKEHGRADSHYSGLPLLKDGDPHSPGTEEASTLVMDGNRRSRYHSGISDFMAAPGSDEKRQNSGALPAIDLGLDLEADLPRDFVTDKEDGRSPSAASSRVLTPQEREDLAKKEELLAEINDIRKSIDVLRSGTPGSSGENESRSRHQSFTSRRTLSLGFADALEGPSRPPRAVDPRTRVQSMDRLSSGDLLAVGNSIGRPSSVPLKDEDSWNDYVRERKLFQPPGGVSPPINTGLTATSGHRASLSVPNAVSDALYRRQLQEAAIEHGEFGQIAHHARPVSHTSEDDRPLSKLYTPQPKTVTTGSKVPVTILPPRKPDASQQTRPVAPRTRTFEELTERHREKMRGLQAPLSQAEKEHAALAEARSRWERSKEVEKQVMAKKQAEKQAAVKQRQEEKEEQKLSTRDPHQRSLSADKLSKLPGSSSTSKRQSMLKVEDWRRYQQEVETAGPMQPSVNRDSVAFPSAQASRDPGHRHSPSGERRRSQVLP